MRAGPDPDRFPFLDSDGVLAFAHRGGHRVAPENTVAAFDHAVSLGYRYLETDVHRTADGVLVAFHDPALERFTGDDRRIADLTAAELGEIVLTGPDGTGHRIPTLDELLERFPEERWNIDPKADDAVEPLAALIELHSAIDRVCIGSFSDARVARLRTLLGPRLCTSPGPRAILSALLPWPVPGEHPCVSIPTTVGHVSLSRPIVRRFQSQGYRVHVWTVNDVDEMHRMIDLGVDGIMTDECERLRAVLEERNAWG